MADAASASVPSAPAPASAAPSAPSVSPPTAAARAAAAASPAAAAVLPKLVRQLGYYWSAANLRRDKFLTTFAGADGLHAVPLATLLTFNKLRELGGEVRDRPVSSARRGGRRSAASRRIAGRCRTSSPARFPFPTIVAGGLGG